MLTLVRKSQFKRDFKKIRAAGKNVAALIGVIQLLQAEKPLPEKYRDHALIGNYRGYRECHIASDWLLIYQQTDTELILVRTGSHSELFR